jgi:alginate O-acetyltransferase complex protein AlgI
MLFNSLEFFLFFALVLLVYWGVLRKKVKLQNAFILLCSYFFYGWWNWQLLSLIFISSATDYVLGQQIHKAPDVKRRKAFLIASLVVNLGLLCTFKYFNFFADSFVDLFNSFGVYLNYSTLHIVLPIGISFYTLQTLSYTIDIYQKKLKPTNDPVAFFAFVSFFPQLVAGPIERARNFLPQFFEQRKIDPHKVKTALTLILWGLFKKVGVADNLDPFVNVVYSNPADAYNYSVVLAAIFFSFQIYCDFSGYTDIARGAARLLGFEIMVNFNLPFFASSVKTFWRRWHISLSTWFRDYLYIPLGGSKTSLTKWMVITIFTFGISGLWHGANWTFIAWGIFHGVFIVLEFFIHKWKVIKFRIPKTIGIILTFSIFTIGLMIFRAQTIGDVPILFQNIFNADELMFTVLGRFETFTCFLMLGVLVVTEWVLTKEKLFRRLQQFRVIRWSYFYLLIFLIILFGETAGGEFIYFQF